MLEGEMLNSNHVKKIFKLRINCERRCCTRRTSVYRATVLNLLWSM